MNKNIKERNVQNKIIRDISEGKSVCVIGKIGVGKNTKLYNLIPFGIRTESTLMVNRINKEVKEKINRLNTKILIIDEIVIEDLVYISELICKGVQVMTTIAATDLESLNNRINEQNLDIDKIFDLIVLVESEDGCRKTTICE